VLGTTESYNELWYNISELAGLIPLATAGCFAIFGLCQAIKRKSLFKVDSHLFVLAGFYAALLLAYVGFEIIEINFRPVLIEGELEASYPSSHTLLAICVVGSAIFALGRLFGDKKYVLWINIASAVLMAATVMLRTFSGVHWITDIFGGILLSFALVFFYCGAAVLNTKKEKLENKSEA
jgi:undecaprenyl-diphosphatase